MSLELRTPRQIGTHNSASCKIQNESMDPRTRSGSMPAGRRRYHGARPFVVQAFPPAHRPQTTNCRNLGVCRRLIFVSDIRSSVAHMARLAEKSALLCGGGRSLLLRAFRGGDWIRRRWAISLRSMVGLSIPPRTATGRRPTPTPNGCSHGEAQARPSSVSVKGLLRNSEPRWGQE